MSKHRKPNPFLTDDENPEWTAADFRRARPAREVLPNLVAAYERKKIKSKTAKTAVVSIALDRDVLRILRAKGSDWKIRVNDLLKAAVNIHA